MNRSQPENALLHSSHGFERLENILSMIPGDQPGLDRLGLARDVLEQLLGEVTAVGAEVIGDGIASDRPKPGRKSLSAVKGMMEPKYLDKDLLRQIACSLGVTDFFLNVTQDWFLEFHVDAVKIFHTQIL